MNWRTNTLIGAAVCMGLLAQSAAAIPPELSTGKKATPKDSEVYTLVGATLAKVFDTFQAPMDMTAADADTKNPAVCLDYDSFGYIIRDNKVVTCIFWANWPSTIHGISFNQTYDQMVEALGKPQITSVSTSGVIRLTWPLKENDRDLELVLEFTKDKKLDRVIVRSPLPPDPKLEAKKRVIQQKRDESKPQQESQQTEDSQK